MRPSSSARIMIEIELKSTWSTCQRGQVGSALVTYDGVITVPAYNGTAKRMPSCKELGADPNERCPYCLHSEENVINHASRLGVKTEGQMLYTLKRPCLGCSNHIVQAGISAVVYRWDYDTDKQLDYVKDMFYRNNIWLTKLDMTSEEVTFSNMLKEWKATWAMI